MNFITIQQQIEWANKAIQQFIKGYYGQQITDEFRLGHRLVYLTAVPHAHIDFENQTHYIMFRLDTKIGNDLDVDYIGYGRYGDSVIAARRVDIVPKVYERPWNFIVEKRIK